LGGACRELPLAGDPLPNGRRRLGTNFGLLAENPRAMKNHIRIQPYIPRELHSTLGTYCAVANETVSAVVTRDYGRHWTPVHIDFVVDDVEAALRRAVDAGARAESPVEAYS